MNSSNIPAPARPRSAFITGAGRGMGFAHARVLSESGYRVALTDLTEGLVWAAAEELDSDLVLPIVCDVTHRNTVETAVAQFAEWADGIDVLVSNAGLIHSNESLADTDDDFWHRTFAVHVDGALNTSRACLPWLERSGTGRMIFVSSIWGQSGIGHSYAYCAAKAPSGVLEERSQGARREGHFGQQRGTRWCAHRHDRRVQ